MLYCLPYVIKTVGKKHTQFFLPNLGHSWRGWEAKTESGYTFLRFLTLSLESIKYAY